MNIFQTTLNELKHVKVSLFPIKGTQTIESYFLFSIKGTHPTPYTPPPASPPHNSDFRVLEFRSVETRQPFFEQMHASKNSF